MESEMEFMIVVKVRGYGMPEHKQRTINRVVREMELTLGSQFLEAYEISTAVQPARVMVPESHEPVRVLGRPAGEGGDLSKPARTSEDEEIWSEAMMPTEAMTQRVVEQVNEDLAQLQETCVHLYVLKKINGVFGHRCKHCGKRRPLP